MRHPFFIVSVNNLRAKTGEFSPKLLNYIALFDGYACAEFKSELRFY